MLACNFISSPFNISFECEIYFFLEAWLTHSSILSSVPASVLYTEQRVILNLVEAGETQLTWKNQTLEGVWWNTQILVNIVKPSNNECGYGKEKLELMSIIESSEV